MTPRSLPLLTLVIAALSASCSNDGAPAGSPASTPAGDTPNIETETSDNAQPTDNTETTATQSPQAPSPLPPIALRSETAHNQLLSLPPNIIREIVPILAPDPPADFELNSDGLTEDPHHLYLLELADTFDPQCQCRSALLDIFNAAGHIRGQQAYVERNLIHGNPDPIIEQAAADLTQLYTDTQLRQQAFVQSIPPNSNVMDIMRRVQAPGMVNDVVVYNDRLYLNQYIAQSPAGRAEYKQLISGWVDNPRPVE